MILGISYRHFWQGKQDYPNKSEEERSGILSTALAFLGLYSDPIVARNTADSDFRIRDLMQAEHPMSLYIVVPDSDRLRLKPLTRMMMTMITQRLVEDHNPKENKHRLLLLIDEFPRSAKLPFFTDALAYLAGYNIKVMLVMQSKSQLDAPDAHGVGNTLIESCKVRSVATPRVALLLSLSKTTMLSLRRIVRRQDWLVEPALLHGQKWQICPLNRPHGDGPPEIGD
jgi:type IV secretory pathway TraG/TraD family ATPase VirD4